MVEGRALAAACAVVQVRQSGVWEHVMSSINDAVIKQPATMPESAPDAVERRPAEQTKPESPQGATEQDLEGVAAPPPQPKPIAALAVPVYASASTQAEVAAALEKVEGKAPDVQKAVAEAAAALGAVNAQIGKNFADNILGGLVSSVINAAKNDLGGPFGSLYARLEGGLEEALRVAPENAPLKLAAESARTIMDILEKPGAHGRTEELEKALADLAAMALIAEDAADEEKLAAAAAATLHNVLGIASEAAALGDKLTELLREIKTTFPLLHIVPDAVAASGAMTNKAVLGLAMIVTAKVRQELAALQESRDDESRRAQELREKKLNIHQMLVRDKERAAELDGGQAASSSAFVNALSQCGDAGLEMINALILQRQVDSVPRTPV